MGKGGQQVGSPEPPCQTQFNWDDVKKHTSNTNGRWIVIENQVYDITRWVKKHPGGSRVIAHYSGQDATEAFRAFHPNETHVRKFLKPIHLGSLDEEVKEDDKDKSLREDFAVLRKTAEEMGCFKPSVTFYLLNVGHVLMFEVLSYLILSYFGTGWVPLSLAIICHTIMQAQAGWIQHDFGHLSVFKSPRLNRYFHFFIMNMTKGASKHWWNHLHYQHHAKPNVVGKDPDVRLDKVFVLGEEIPEMVAKTRKSSMPFNWQHRYFFIIGPPLLFPLYFQIMMFYHSITRRVWLDLALMTFYYVKMAYLYSPMLGLGGTVLFYMAVRVLESHWFVWVSQSNHIPMEIASDKERPWVALQLHATCNIVKSYFNDWFTGHLNFQIEHHLFPTMPRHNLYKIAPLAESLCKKHNIPYILKTLPGAFSDIVQSLEHSGQVWEHFYNAYHS